jgi:legumain
VRQQFIYGRKLTVKACCRFNFKVESARAYHALIKGGVPTDNIIVFMEGSIINKTECNPDPGHLYKDTEKSFDFLPGLQVDYVGETHTTENFLSVIQGNSSGVQGGSGRVLKR